MGRSLASTSEPKHHRDNSTLVGCKRGVDVTVYYGDEEQMYAHSIFFQRKELFELLVLGPPSSRFHYELRLPDWDRISVLIFLRYVYNDALPPSFTPYPKYLRPLLIFAFRQQLGHFASHLARAIIPSHLCDIQNLETIYDEAWASHEFAPFDNMCSWLTSNIVELLRGNCDLSFFTPKIARAIVGDQHCPLSPHGRWVLYTKAGILRNKDCPPIRLGDFSATILKHVITPTGIMSTVDIATRYRNTAHEIAPKHHELVISKFNTPVKMSGAFCRIRRNNLGLLIESCDKLPLGGLSFGLLDSLTGEAVVTITFDKEAIAGEGDDGAWHKLASKPEWKRAKIKKGYWLLSVARV